MGAGVVSRRVLAGGTRANIVFVLDTIQQAVVNALGITAAGLAVQTAICMVWINIFPDFPTVVPGIEVALWPMEVVAVSYCCRVWSSAKEAKLMTAAALVL